MAHNRRQYNQNSPLRAAKQVLGPTMFSYIRQAEIDQIRPGATYGDLRKRDRKFVDSQVARVASDWQPPLDLGDATRREREAKRGQR